MVSIGTDLDFRGTSKILNLPNPSTAGEPVNKAVHDAAVATLNTAIANLTGQSIKAPTALNASANPDYPSATAGASFLITVAGRVGGAAGDIVNIGDLVICTTTNAGGDKASVGSNFFILESNRDKASETVLGLVQLATVAEVTAGTNAEKAIVPATLQAKLDSLQFVGLIGNGVATSFNITHNINKAGLRTVEVMEVATGEAWIVGVKRIDNNTVQVNFAFSPSNDQFQVTVS